MGPFKVQRIAGAIGAEISGVDLSGELPPETVGEIRRVMERITLKGDKPG